MLLDDAWAWGDFNMTDIAQGVLFILACASLFGVSMFLFRDQITSRRREF
jgi:hypothetical protein